MMVSLRAVFVASVASLLVVSSTVAAPPSIAKTAPQAVAPNSKVQLTIHGGNLVGATELWTSFAGTAELDASVTDNGKNAAQITFQLTVPPNAPVGVHGVRVASSEGVSQLALMVVDDLPTVAQQGNNTTAANAQELSIPCAVDGTIGSLSRNYYRITVAAGQRLAVEALARRLGSPLDPMIRILDGRGRELTYSDDAPGLSGDSQLCYTFSEAGQYLVEIRDIRYQGGGNFRYRIRLGDFPCVTVPYPMAVRRGEETSVLFAGSHVDDVQPVKVSVPPASALGWVNVGARRSNGKASGFAILAVGDGNEFVEAEPNNGNDAANKISLDQNVNGRLDQPGDSDRFVFEAKKGQQVTFRAVTREQGSPTDLYLRVLKQDGAQLAAAEDAGTSDALLNYTFPDDGSYVLAVEDLHRRGGPAFAYRVVVGPTQPGFDLAASAETLNIPAGGTAAVTVTVTRRNYAGPIEVAAIDLPEGVTSQSTVIGPGMNSVVLTLRTTAEAPVGKVFPSRVVGRAKIGDREVSAQANIAAPLKAIFNGIPWPPQTLAGAVAIGVAPAVPVKLRAEPATLVFGRDLKATTKIIAERSNGFDQQIDLKITPEKGGLPGGIAVAVKPIPAGQNEVEIVFSANNKAPIGDFTAVLNATTKKDKTTITQPIPGIRFAVQAPYSLQLQAGEGKLQRGGQLKVKVVAERNPAFTGDIAVTFNGLPKGVTAPATVIKADQREVEIPLSAAQDAVAGAVDIHAKGDAKIGETAVAETSSPIKLTVE